MKSGKIVINNEFEIEKDVYCWQVNHYFNKKRDTWKGQKTKKERSCKKTFHGTLIQACKHIINESVEEVDSVSKIIDEFECCCAQICDAIKNSNLEKKQNISIHQKMVRTHQNV